MFVIVLCATDGNVLFVIRVAKVVASSSLGRAGRACDWDMSFNGSLALLWAYQVATKCNDAVHQNQQCQQLNHADQPSTVLWLAILVMNGHLWLFMLRNI